MQNTTEDLLRIKKVSTGISLVFYGLELFALSIITVSLAPFLLQSRVIDILLLFRIVQIAAYMLIASSLMGFIGKYFCMSAPKEVPGRFSIKAAVLLEIVVFAISVLQLFTNMPVLVSESTSLLSVISFFFFLVFLENLAIYLVDDMLIQKSRKLMNIAYSLVFMLVITTGLSVFAFQILSAFKSSSLILYYSSIITLVGAITLILGILGLMRYSRLLWNFKRKLRAVVSQPITENLLNQSVDSE